jgi:octaprenyl-diphosphate synthase
MKPLDAIKLPVEMEMAQFEKRFRASMSSKVPLLDRITHYIVKRKGKQMRPLFVFLSAKMHGDITDSSYRAASLIELLHTATLVHDDVVDESYMRRGFFSLNALWKNKIAVLVGDYLLSRGLLVALDNGEFELLKIVSTAVREMSEGELLQIEKARRLDIDEEVYFEIIRQKTATLIAACCASGAHSVGADTETVAKMRQFGETVGIAFQLKDDLFDYQATDITGKPVGIDIKEQKMTLPVIYAANRASSAEKRWIIRTIKHHHDRPEKVAELIEYIKNSGGIDYAQQTMERYRQEALNLLDSMPQNEASDALRRLVTFVIERKK